MKLDEKLLFKTEHIHNKFEFQFEESLLTEDINNFLTTEQHVEKYKNILLSRYIEINTKINFPNRQIDKNTILTKFEAKLNPLIVEDPIRKDYEERFTQSVLKFAEKDYKYKPTVIRKGQYATRLDYHLLDPALSDQLIYTHFVNLDNYLEKPNEFFHFIEYNAKMKLKDLPDPIYDMRSIMFQTQLLGKKNIFYISMMHLSDIQKGIDLYEKVVSADNPKDGFKAAWHPYVIISDVLFDDVIINKSIEHMKRTNYTLNRDVAMFLNETLLETYEDPETSQEEKDIIVESLRAKDDWVNLPELFDFK